MTDVRIVDTSALAAVLFGEADADEDRFVNVALAAPRLIDFELANVCRTKCHRHPERAPELWLARRHLDRRLGAAAGAAAP